MQCCATDFVSFVQVWVQSQHLLKLAALARRSDMHEQVDAAVHDWIVHWETVRDDALTSFNIASVDGFNHDLFGTSERRLIALHHVDRLSRI